MTDSALARAAYADGTHPVDWAVHLAQTQIEVAGEILAARAWNPRAYPVFAGELTPAAVARRIVGELLDAGWTPPSTCDECQGIIAPGWYCAGCGRHS